MQNKKKISLGFFILILVSVLGIGIASAATLNGPELTIPSNIPARANSYVDIPIRFDGNGTQVSQITFSIDYNENWLDYDQNDPSAYEFNLPSQFNGSCGEAPTGEIQCSVIVVQQYPLPTLPDGEFLTLRLQTLNAPDDTLAEVFFADNPSASFGGPDGQAVPDGITNDGSVLLGDVTSIAYLPLLSKIIPTITPTPIPTDPVPTDPVPTDPVPTDPVPTDPVPTDPVPPTCENIIVDWSFENQDDAWVLNPTEYQAQYTNQRSNTGDWSVITGIQDPADNKISYSSVSQDVVFPSNIDSATLSFWHFSQSSETSQLLGPLFLQKYIFNMMPDLYDFQYVVAIKPNNTTWLYSTTNDNTHRWVKETIDMSNFEGESIILRFSTYNDGGDGVSAMFVDDIILEICK